MCAESFCNSNSPTQLFQHRYDLGGKKGSLSELPSDCAARKFTKYTYGLFSVDSDWDDPNVERNVLDLYRKKENVPLLSKSGTGWAKMWLLQSGRFSFCGVRYRFGAVPVPFLPAVVASGRWAPWTSVRDCTTRPASARCTVPDIQALREGFVSLGPSTPVR